jgi:hypothetical protein
VYVRQSTPDQIMNNPESRRRQYALATPARTLGWRNVIIIDDNLVVRAATACPGFEHLLTAICAGSAGAVLAIGASRLARNGRDWHTLLEFCTLVNSMIIDEDSVYDPKLTNDRLLLGMKGTFSKLELKGLWVERSRWFGDVYLALALWRGVGLEELCERMLPVGKERIAWSKMAAFFWWRHDCASRRASCTLPRIGIVSRTLADDRGHDGGPARNGGAGLDH